MEVGWISLVLASLLLRTEESGILVADDIIHCI